MDGEKTPRSRRSTTISFSSSATTTSPPDEHNVDKLKELLRQEAYSHKETGQCYSTLQKEYDDLLKKYAEAENTIDKLRIGARIKLYYDSPPPQQADNEVFLDMRSKSTQFLHLAQPQKAHLSRTYSMPERLLTKKRGLSSSLPAPSRVSEEDLVARLQCLQNDVTNFHTLLSDGECTLQEQREINEGLKDEFSMIKDEFKTLENNGSRNRAYSTNSKISEDFGGANSLQAEVYRLGLRLEEIDEEIGDQIRQQQQQQKPSTTTGNTGYEDNLLNGGCGDSVVDDNCDDPSLNQRYTSSSSSHPPNKAEKNSPKKCSPDSIRVSRQTDQRYAQTSIPPEANPEESGYYTGRSHPPVANSYTTGIESKYLSQSMKKNPPSAYSYETEDRVGSWVSKSHQSALNKSPISQSEQMKYSNSQSDRHSGHRKSQSESRRRTRSSDGSISLSSSNKLRLNNRRRRSQTQEETKLKNVDPNNNHFDNDNIKKLSVTPENVRPFTHNSTEDSGFMDYRSHASRTQSQPQSPLRVWDGGSSVPENFPSPTSNSPTEGEQYRQRLDSLRNFVLAKRQGDGNTSGTARPRSWVRGKSPTNYSPSVASSRTKDRGIDRPSTLPVRPLSSTTHDHNNNTQHHPQREDQDMYNSNNNRLKKHIQQPRRSLHQTEDIERQSIVSGSSSTRDRALETLQDEMHDIRDIVLDLKSSLHLKEQNNNIANEKKSPRFEKHTAKTKTTPSKPRKVPKEIDPNSKQIEMFERLNDTIEKLSNKIENFDKHSIQSDQGSSQHEESITDENSNSITNENTDMIPHLKRMNERVDNIQEYINTKEREQKLKEVDEQLLHHQTSLVKNLENKLHSMEKQFKESTTRTNSNHSPTHDKSDFTSTYLTLTKEPKFSSTRYTSRSSTHHDTTTPRKHFSPPPRPHHHQNYNDTSSHIIPPQATQLTNNNVIHHYHSFCGTVQHPEDHQHRHSLSKSMNQTTQHQRTYNTPKALESSHLYESIDSATKAAQRMENLSKRMLSTIASDLYNADEMNEY